MLARSLGLADPTLAAIPEARNAKRYAYFCPVKVNNTKAYALLDSGNLAGNVISLKFAQLLGYKRDQIQPLKHLQQIGTAKKGERLTVCGVLPKPLYLQFGGLATKFKTKPMVIDGLSMNVNISGPFMAKHSIDQMHSRNALSVQGHLVPLFGTGANRTLAAMQQTETTSSVAYVTNDTIVPPLSACFLPLRIPEVEKGQMSQGEGIVEATQHFVESTDCHPVLSALVVVDSHGETHTSVMNSLDRPIKITRGQRFGVFYRNDPPSVCSLGANTATKQSSGLDTKGKVKKRASSVSPGSTSPSLSRSELRKRFNIDSSPALETSAQRERALDLLEEFSDLFSTGDQYGKTTLVEHEINTRDAAPVRCKNRPLNPALESKLREQLDHWLAQDVIESSTSPWSFALLAVPKKNGKIRWCVDYRRLNDVTVKDSFPLPNIEANLSRLSKSKIFSGIDGTGAYHVVSIKESDRPKTAFATPWGLYQFKQMSFGLCNAPATYSRLVQKVLDGIPPEVALPYLDDTCIHSPTFEHHIEGLRRVFAAHRKAGLMLQPEKCQLFQKQIEYLGHLISEEGTSIPPKYTEIVRGWPYPTTLTELRAFLGKVQYYRKFILGFSKIALPLSELVKQDAKEPIPKTPETLHAFNTLKDCLSSAPILAYPDFASEHPFIVDTDWSKDAIGAVLSQVQDRQERVIAYGARKLNSAERNYSSNKGEMLAVIHFLKQWRYYLLHRPFVLRTDHQALRWLKTMQEPKGMMIRWLDLLANYQFEIQFRPGKKHGNADALSRAPHAASEAIEGTDEDEMEQSLLCPLRSLPSLRAGIARLRDEQKKDETLRKVRTFISTNEWPNGLELRALDPALRLYVSLKPQLEINDDLVVRKVRRANQAETKLLCVPDSLQAAIVRQCHEDSGHRGINNTYEQTVQRFFFPSMSVQAKMTVAECTRCQKNKGAPQPQRHTLVSHQDSHPFSRLSIDFVGPMPASAQGNRYILTVRDCFTRWIEGFPTMDMTAATVASLLEKEIFTRYGLPEVIHSDQGTNFTSSLLQEVYKELNIQSTTTPAYNPKSNPVERTHRDLKSLLAACVDTHAQEWEDYLPLCLWAIRVTKNRSTGFSPFFLLYGRDPALEVDLLYGTPPREKYGPIEYANLLRKRLNVTFSVARENMKTSIARARRQYRGKLAGQPLKADDLVWLFTPSLAQKTGRKLATLWTGPYRVLEVLSPVLFRIRVEGNWNKTPLEMVVTIDRLRRYTCSEPPDEVVDYREGDFDTADEFVELAGEADVPVGPPPTGGGAPLPVIPEVPPADDPEPGPPEPPAPPGPAPPAPPPPPPDPPEPQPPPADTSMADVGDPPADASMADAPEPTRPDHEMSSRSSSQSSSSPDDSPPPRPSPAAAAQGSSKPPTERSPKSSLPFPGFEPTSMRPKSSLPFPGFEPTSMRLRSRSSRRIQSPFHGFSTPEGDKALSPSSPPARPFVSPPPEPKRVPDPPIGAKPKKIKPPRKDLEKKKKREKKEKTPPAESSQDTWSQGQFDRPSFTSYRDRRPVQYETYPAGDSAEDVSTQDDFDESFAAAPNWPSTERDKDRLPAIHADLRSRGEALDSSIQMPVRASSPLPDEIVFRAPKILPPRRQTKRSFVRPVDHESFVEKKKSHKEAQTGKSLAGSSPACAPTHADDSRALQTTEKSVSETDLSGTMSRSRLDSGDVEMNADSTGRVRTRSMTARTRGYKKSDLAEVEHSSARSSKRTLADTSLASNPAQLRRPRK